MTTIAETVRVIDFCMDRLKVKEGPVTSYNDTIRSILLLQLRAQAVGNGDRVGLLKLQISALHLLTLELEGECGVKYTYTSGDKKKALRGRLRWYHYECYDRHGRKRSLQCIASCPPPCECRDI